jgi:hypothetical protein
MGYFYYVTLLKTRHTGVVLSGPSVAAQEPVHIWIPAFAGMTLNDTLLSYR